MLSNNRWLVLAIVSSALFLIVIDMTVLYTALPRLTHDLAASPVEKLWILNAYPLVVAGLLPGLGTLGDRVGHRQMFLAGLIAFGIASLFAAFAPSANALIAARAGLAIGAAAMMPATLSLIRLSFPDDDEQAFAIGIWAAVASGGAAFGPLIGGILLEWFWWGSVFLVNVPVVILALAAGYFILERHPGNPNRPWDFWSSVLIMLGLIGVVQAVKFLAMRQPSLLMSAASALVGAFFIAAFFWRQKRQSEQMIDFTLFQNPRFSAGAVTALTTSTVLIGLSLVLTQHLQLVDQLSPLQAALMALPIPIAAIIAGPLVGHYMRRIGMTRILWSSLMLVAIALAGFLYTFSHDAVWAMLPLALAGFGLGGAITAASSAVMMSAPKDRAGMAASIEEVSYELGGALGVTLMGSLMSVIYSRMMVLPAGLDVSEEVRDSLDEAFLISEKLDPETAAEVIRLGKEAFSSAFYGVCILAVVLLVIVSLVLRHKTKGVDEAERS